MKLPQFLKSFIARIAKYLTEASAMTDVNTIGSGDYGLTPSEIPYISVDHQDVVAAIATAASAAAVVVEPAVNTDTLKAVLAALGHDLDAVWADAIALAKKAL